MMTSGYSASSTNMRKINTEHDFTRAAVIEDCVLRSPVRVKVTGKVLGVNANHPVGRTTMMLKIWGFRPSALQ